MQQEKELSVRVYRETGTLREHLNANAEEVRPSDVTTSRGPLECDQNAECCVTSVAVAGKVDLYGSYSFDAFAATCGR